MRDVLCAGVCLLLLSSCTAAPPPPIVQTRIEVEHVTVPASLLSCPPAPAAPVNATLQSQVADWIARFYVADEACREDLAQIAALNASEGTN